MAVAVLSFFQFYCRRQRGEKVTRLACLFPQLLIFYSYTLLTYYYVRACMFIAFAFICTHFSCFYCNLLQNELTELTEGRQGGQFNKQRTVCTTYVWISNQVVCYLSAECAQGELMGCMKEELWWKIQNRWYFAEYEHMNTQRTFADNRQSLTASWDNISLQSAFRNEKKINSPYLLAFTCVCGLTDVW